MKPLYLSIDNQADKEKQEFDLSTQKSLAIMCEQDIAVLREFLVQAFYGTGEQGKLELLYEYNGEGYLIKRNFETNLAQLLYSDGKIIVEGENKVNELVNSQLKLSQQAFNKLLVIDGDEVYDNFIKEREHYIGSLLDELVFDKAEVSLIENKIQEKYDNTKMQIELTGEVSVQELADKKKEIEQKQLIKQDIDAERIAVKDNIIKAERAIVAQEELVEEEKLYAEALSKQYDIGELYGLLKVSNQAEMLDKLISQKQKLIERDKYISKDIQELASKIEQDNKEIAKGEVSKNTAEKSLINCLTRLQELRKLFYGNIDALASDEETRQRIADKISQYYHRQQKELASLYEKKGGIEDALSELEKVHIDIYLRMKHIEKDADLRRAIRESATLEAEMKRLMDIMAEAKLEVTSNKKSKHKPKKKQIENSIDEELIMAEKVRKELFECYVEISKNIQGISEIENAIQKKETNILKFEADKLTLSGIKDALMKYIVQQKKNKKALEDKVSELQSQYEQQKQEENTSLIELENSSLASTIERIISDIGTATNAITDYEEKLYYIKQRDDELIKEIKEAYRFIEVSQQEKKHNEITIKGILAKVGAENFYQLTQQLDNAEYAQKQLARKNKNIVALTKERAEQQEKLERSSEDIAIIENEQFPVINTQYQQAQEQLKICQVEYDALKDIIGEEAVLTQLEDVVAIEQEYSQLKKDLIERLEKIESLLCEKAKTEELISFLEEKGEKIIIADKEYDFSQLNMKVISDFVSGDIFKELKKWEAKSETLKTEVLAVERVLSVYRQRRDENLKELYRLNAKLESDKEIMEQIMLDFDGKMAILHIDNTKDLRKKILSDSQKEEIKNEIAIFNGAIALFEHRVHTRKTIVENNLKHIELLEEYQTTLTQLNDRYEHLSMEIASISAKREEMKSRAKQLFALKEKLNKYEEKLKVLGEIANLIKVNGDITDYVIKLASKKIYSLTKGKYNLDVEEGQLNLHNNRKGGKVVELKDYSEEEELLMSLVLGVSLHRTLIDMVGGESLMLFFPLRTKNITRATVAGIASYIKKEKVAVCVDNENMFEIFSYSN